MADVERPQRPELLTPVLSDDELRAMFTSCGNDFDGIRDIALMRFLLTTGGRRSECVGITLADLDLRAQTVKVMGKGRRERLIHIEDGTALALRKYIRTRQPTRRRPPPTGCGSASSARSPATASSKSSNGAPRLPASTTPTRTPGATPSPTAGPRPAATEGGLMSEAGWRSAQMVRRYARSAASDGAVPNSPPKHCRRSVSGPVDHGA